MQLKTVKSQGWSRPWVRFALLEVKEGRPFPLNWKECKEEIINDYVHGETIKTLSEKYDMRIPNLISNLQRSGVYHYANRKWTKEETEYLRKHYPVDSWDDLLNHFVLDNKNSLAHKAKAIGVRRSIQSWTQSDLKILKDCYSKKLPTAEIAKLMCNRHSISAIQSKAAKLGMRRTHGWSDEEVLLLTAVYEHVPSDELQNIFPNYKLRHIQEKARLLGLHSALYLERKWTTDEDSFVESNWDSMTDAEMSTILGRTIRSIKWRREKLGLIRKIPPGTYEYLRKYLWKTNKRWRKESIAA